MLHQYKEFTRNACYATIGPCKEQVSQLVLPADLLPFYVHRGIPV